LIFLTYKAIPPNNPFRRPSDLHNLDQTSPNKMC